MKSLSFLSEQIEKSRKILSSAINEYNPCIALVGFSGGNDSTICVYLTAMLCRELDLPFAVFHCNTGIGIEATRVFVRDICKLNKWELHEEYPPYKSYRDTVLEYGFPGPDSHKVMYSILKERAIRVVVRKYPKKERKLIVTGVRTSESARRMMTANKDIDKRGRQIWTSLMRHWDEEDMEEFRELHKIPVNEVTCKMGMSGECLCGAYAKKGELDRIKEHYPDTYNEIIALEKETKELGFTWGWDDVPPTGMDYLKIMEKIQPGYTDKYMERLINKRQKKTGQIDMFQPLCSHCNTKYQNDINKKKAGF